MYKDLKYLLFPYYISLILNYKNNYFTNCIIKMVNVLDIFILS